MPIPMPTDPKGCPYSGAPAARADAVYELCPGCGWLRRVLAGRLVPHPAPPTDPTMWWERLAP